MSRSHPLRAVDLGTRDACRSIRVPGITHGNTSDGAIGYACGNAYGIPGDRPAGTGIVTVPKPAGRRAYRRSIRCTRVPPSDPFSSSKTGNRAHVRNRRPSSVSAARTAAGSAGTARGYVRIDDRSRWGRSVQRNSAVRYTLPCAATTLRISGVSGAGATIRASIRWLVSVVSSRSVIPRAINPVSAIAKTYVPVSTNAALAGRDRLFEIRLVCCLPPLNNRPVPRTIQSHGSTMKSVSP